MTDIVFDTGALVRLQRDRNALSQLLEVAERDHLALVTSAASLTEFLGGSPRTDRAGGDWIASLLKPAVVNEVVARRGATLMRAALDGAPSSSPGPIDALVAAEAERAGADVVISGDRKDFEALANASGRFRVIDLEDLLSR